ncbi:hypothetical protein AKJ39_01265 [candidate division MSBL1 archaeon SCGC-AAA259J03]|uniref:Uncharacterized protein n=1 Tax=candidate division MSBL1 archaeon SCGC-AAA259J03 TaxID=1698269 RepID=A0A656YXI4_9EURY|nr:hypothetical protein AKJ39_01265 [candidate division MSBL1 archaeon SCGC-AAA259J03]
MGVISLKLETNRMYLVDLDGDVERQVFLDKEKVADFLMKNMEEPKEKVRKVIKGEEVEGPMVVKVEVPSDLAEDEGYKFRRELFSAYLADVVL